MINVQLQQQVCLLQNYTEKLSTPCSSLEILMHTDMGQSVLIAFEAMCDLLVAYPS
jgi:hypothetical protein